MWSDADFPEATAGFYFDDPFVENLILDTNDSSACISAGTSDAAFSVRDNYQQACTAHISRQAGVEFGSKDLNNNPKPVDSPRTAYGTGCESKKKAPHPDDQYQYQHGPSFTCLSAYLRNPRTGRMPRSEELYKAFRILVDKMPVDRQAKRRLAVMYKWLDDHWEVQLVTLREQYTYKNYV